MAEKVQKSVPVVLWFPTNYWVEPPCCIEDFALIGTQYREDRLVEAGNVPLARPFDSEAFLQLLKAAELLTLQHCLRISLGGFVFRNNAWQVWKHLIRIRGL